MQFSICAGRPRRADLGSCLSAIADAFNNNADFDVRVRLQVEEVDVLRGGPFHDLLSAATRKDYLQDTRSGRHAALVTAPPCETHTRARHANRSGPPPLRSKAWPRGLPGLTSAQQEQLRRSNLLAYFCNRSLRSCFGSRHACGDGISPKTWARHAWAIQHHCGGMTGSWL